MELQHHLTTKKPEIVLMTETWLTKRNILKLKGYKLIRNDRKHGNDSNGGRGGGTAIIFKDSITAEVITLQNDTKSFEMTGAVITLTNGSRMALLAIYRPQSTPFDTIEFAQVINEIRRLAPKIIIGGDFNAHHTDWGNKHSSSEGRKLKSISEDLNLNVFRSEYPSRQTTTSASFLDLFLVEKHVQICGSHLLKSYPYDSDHDCIELKIQLASPINRSLQNTFLDWSKANVDQIRADMVRFCREFPVKRHESISTSEIDDHIELLTLHLTNSIEANVPRRTSKQFMHVDLDQVTTKLIRERRKTRRILCRIKQRVAKNELTPDAMAVPMSTINLLNPLIEANVTRCRTEAFARKCQETTNGNNLFKSIRLLSAYKRKSDINANLSTNGSILSTNKEKANALVDHFRKIHEEAEGRGDIHRTREINERIKREYDSHHAAIEFSLQQPACIDETNHNDDILITTEETMFNVHKTNNKRSAGHDCITNWLLRKLPVKFYEEITVIFNHCINRGYFPDYWKLATIMPILKNKKDSKLISSYRPISMLSNISKLLERAIKRKIDDHLDTHAILQNNQFGFTKHSSTEDALFVLNSLIVNALNQRQTFFAISIDTEKAFDSVWKEGLITKMNMLQFDTNIIRLIFSFMTNRYITVKIGTEISNWKQIRAGVPQGSVLSPSLYNIYIFDMPQPDTFNTTSIQFADDQLLMSSDNNTEESIEDLQSFMNITKQYCDTWKLKINNEKCKFIKISGLKKHQLNETRRATRRATITIENTPIDEVDQLKYLGINFNNKYQFGNHASEMCKRGQMAYNIVNHLFRQKAMSPDVKRTIYKTLIRPTMNYAFSAWHSITPSQMESLRLMERKILRKIHQSNAEREKTVSI